MGEKEKKMAKKKEVLAHMADESRAILKSEFLSVRIRG
jgi:hypothetical protein